MNERTKEQLQSFVQNWFSDLDQLKTSEVFLARLDENFEFDIYGTKLYGHRGFLSIYSGMQGKSHIDARHSATNIKIEQLTDTLYQINFDIALEHHQNGNRINRSESVEEWLVKQENGQLIIIKYAII